MAPTAANRAQHTPVAMVVAAPPDRLPVLCGDYLPMEQGGAPVKFCSREIMRPVYITGSMNMNAVFRVQLYFLLSPFCYLSCFSWGLLSFASDSSGKNGAGGIKWQHRNHKSRIE